VASNLRRSRRTFSQRFLTVEQRLANLRRRPIPVRIGTRIVLGNNIAPGTITPPTFSDSVAAYVQETAIPGNSIYYTTTAPPGSDFIEGDLWFDSDNDFALSRWDGTAWVSFGLGTAAFSTIDAGKITTGILNAIQLTGNTITGGTIRIGSGTNVFSVDSNGLYLGNTTFASAPFRVTPAGVLTATQGTFSGSLGTGVSISSPSISGGSISGSSITIGTGGAFQVSDTGAMTATVGFIGGWTIATNTISRGTTVLDSSVVNGSITADLFRTASSGVRIEMGPGALGSADEIFFYDGAGSRCTIRNPGSGQFRVSCSATAGGAVFTVSDTGTSAGLLVTRGTNTNGAQIGGNTIPGSNNAFTLGSSTRRWTEVFATNGVINTSDIRLKTDVEESALGLDFLNRVEPVSYRWIEGTGEEVDSDGNVVTEAEPGVRPHYGFIAQNIKEAFLSCGVDDFAGWTLDDKDDPESSQGLRYSEFIAPIVKAIQELNQKIESLEERLSNS
jgi:hypothetical protein